MLIIGLIAVAAPGIWRRLPIILGAIGGYLLYLLLANGFGLGKRHRLYGVGRRAVDRFAEIDRSELPR
jgi:xanthine/uracil permease